jgi:hypothetical protein
MTFRTSMRAVFAGCARNCEPYLNGSLGNLSVFANYYTEAQFVFVENDSHDATKAILKDWLAGPRKGLLIELDGLAKRETLRVARITAARNAYLKAIRETGLGEFDHLVIADLDGVNSAPVNFAGFVAAAEFLEAAPNAAGVFANASPVYYDIWALRHPTWCPGDCLEAVRKRSWFEKRSSAFKRNVIDRQIPIPPGDQPIPVESAFGGLAIYKMPFARGGTYLCKGPKGEEVCEHVPFNLKIRQAGGELYIVPSFQNHTHP